MNTAKRKRGAKPKLIPLCQWAELAYGPFAPRYVTLRRWALSGRIFPRPEKIGWEWFVRSNAVYRECG